MSTAKKIPYGAGHEPKPSVWIPSLATAYARFIDDVREGRFPSADESYDDPTRDTADGPRRIYG